MPVEVRIPTILRTYAANRSPSQRERPGSHQRPRGEAASLKDRLIEDADLRRFVNVYVNDEDVRFLGGLEQASPTARWSCSPAGG